MKTNQHRIDHTLAGNTLVVTVAVVAFILALLASAISFTEHVSRNSQRSRKAALAMEIADGHLEYLFTNWRNIYRTTWTTYNAASGGTDYSLLGTNYFYTDMFKPGYTNPDNNAASCGTLACASPTPVPNMTPSATPPTIPLPSSSNFPSAASYTVTQYRIQAVDPMIDQDSNDNSVVETSFGSGNFTAMPTAS